MRLQLALPASALLVALSAVALIHAPQPRPRTGLVGRAGIGAIRAIATAGRGRTAPEASHSSAPLTLSASRPDSVAPIAGPGDLTAIETYHEQALEKGHACSTTVLVDSESRMTLRPAVVVEFEKRCEASAVGVKKPKCTTSVLKLPAFGSCLQQAASAILS